MSSTRSQPVKNKRLPQQHQPKDLGLSQLQQLFTLQQGTFISVYSQTKSQKTVENFVGLARKSYYDGIIFHRVIKKFMLQTGDPLGDGTGGESLWGKEFEDEFHKDLKHDRPYTLSMANAGANTNGSQFFLTTVPTPWLDNKHSVFGRAVAGLDVIHKIENSRVDKTDKPR